MKNSSTREKGNRKSQPDVRGKEAVSVDAESVEHIAKAAYYKAEARGFAPGRELDDWLAAETDIRGRVES